MNFFQKNLNNFINNRIDNTLNELRKNNKNYKNKLKEYNTLYHELYSELSAKQLKKFDKIIEISNHLNNKEFISIYKMTIQDFINYKKNTK